MKHGQLILYYLAYLLAARGSLAWLRGRWRIAVFAVINIAAVWILLHAPENLLVPSKLGMFGLYVGLVVFQFVVLTAFADQPGWRPWLAFFTPIAALVAIKYIPCLDFFWQLVHKKPFSVLQSHFLGLSYLAFRASDLVLAVRNKVVKKPGLWEYLSYCFFLPTMSVGPINTYENFQKGFDTPDRAELPLGRSLLRIMVGLVKFIVLSHVCYQFTYDGLLLDGHPHRVADLMVALLAYYLYLYCNFSGFCDLAIGLAGLLGFPVEENFNNPFAARNIQEFWNRWHMTLSRYMRDVVFTPLTKKLVGLFGLARINAAIAVSLFLVFLLVGLWHGVGWNFLAFGAANGLGLVVVHYYTINLKQWLGKEGYKRYVQNKLIRAVAVVVTFVYVALCLSLFANDFATFGKIFSHIK